MMDWCMHYFNVKLMVNVMLKHMKRLVIAATATAS